MKTVRLNLPFRKNCEGYFIDNSGNILAKKDKCGLIIFPGGGIKKEENPKEGIIRETFEETGAKIKNIRKLGKMKIAWGSDWAKTEKQKQRYKKFQGDEMYFFFGLIDKITNKKQNEDDFWDKQKFMKINEVIKEIKSQIPFKKDVKKYRTIQLKFLKEIKTKK